MLVLHTDGAWLFDIELVLNTAKTCAKFFFFHVHTMHIDIIKVLFIHQLMH